MTRGNSDLKSVRSIDVYDQIRREILLRDLAPGSYIDAREKSEIYGTSTVPVREALLRLSEAGMLIRERNRGFAVRRFDNDEIAFASDAIRHLSTFQQKKLKWNKSVASGNCGDTNRDKDHIDPYLFFSELINSASKIFRSHLLQHFCLNMYVVSTAWNVIGGRLLMQDNNLIFLSRFAYRADLDDFHGALDHLKQLNMS